MTEKFLRFVHMCQFNDLTPNIAIRNNSCIMGLCVGEVLLNQWKQGNTCLSKIRKRPLEIGVFFYESIT